MKTRRSVALIAACVALLGACEPEKAAPTAAPTASVAPRRGLYFGSDAVAPKSVLATGTTGQQAWRITISTGPLACDEITATFPERPESKKRTLIDFWIGQPLTPKGTPDRWIFRSAYLSDSLGGRGLLARGGMIDKARVQGDEVVLSGVELALQDRRKPDDIIQYTGELRAISCGRVVRKEEARPQKKLKLSIAGKEYTVGGATVRPRDKKYFLRLTGPPHDCPSRVTEGYDWYLDLALDGEPPQLQFIALHGDLFPETPSGSKGKKTFQVEAKGNLGGAGSVVVRVKGTIDAMGYTVTLAGEVDALRCTPVTQ